MLVTNLQEMIPGPGTYAYLGKVYAQCNGTVKIHKPASWRNENGDRDMIAVDPLVKEQAEEVEELLGQQAVDSIVKGG